MPSPTVHPCNGVLSDKIITEVEKKKKRNTYGSNKRIRMITQRADI